MYKRQEMICDGIHIHPATVRQTFKTVSYTHLPALVIMDAVSRLVGGVLHNEDSAEFDSFHDNLLEYPQYSRPEVWRDKAVPPILMSGHHANVEKWRREQSLIRTLERRPDLLENANLTKQDKKFPVSYTHLSSRRYGFCNTALFADHLTHIVCCYVKFYDCSIFLFRLGDNHLIRMVNQ